MKKHLLVLFSILTSTFFAQSPITLSNSNMPGSGDTLRYSNVLLSTIGNYTQTGTNYTWNYSSVIITSQGRRDYKSAFSTPYAFFFIGFNEYGEKVNDTINLGLITLTDVYNYYKKTTSPNAYVVDGLGMKISAVPVPSYFTDRDELYMFPMTYPKYDSTTFKFSTPTTTLLPLTYSKQGYRVTVVDGWGNVTTPYGSAACLRLVTTQYSQDTIKNSLLPFPVGFPNNQRSYQWLTTSSKIPFLEVSGNLVGNNFAPTQIRFRDNYRNLTGINSQEEKEELITIYPNPVTDKLFLNFKNDVNYSVEIFDINGKTVAKYSVNEMRNNHHYLSVENLSQGVYMVRVMENDKPNVIKFIKQ